MELTASVIYGSVRAERQGIKAARYLHKELKKRITQVHFIDPDEFELPLLDKMYKEYAKGKAPEDMKQVGERLLNSDGFLIVSGEYNHGIPPALKNILDHYQQEYFFKPSAIACYSAGSFGGVRSAMQLRAVLGELGMPSISSILPFPKVQDHFDVKGTPKTEDIPKRTNRFLDEFIWYMEALKEKRKNGTPF
jgi:NAD(P)H-dependent FMN reductase